jgi:phosphoribosyl-ATP pyrophosphohydrolase/phosphoribosyl-AMP cyclohydrolase/histidinol dehydrogenase
MIIPLIGFGEDGAPLLNTLISGDEASGVDPREVIRRLGIASPSMLCMPPAVLAAPPSAEHISIVRDGPAIVGPFSFAAAGEARAWLERGSQFALFAQSSGSFQSMVDAAAAEKLPAERLMLLLDVPALTDTAAVQALASQIESLAAPSGSGCFECCRSGSVGAFSGVVVVVPPGTGAAREQELLQLLAPIAVNDRLQVVIGGLSNWAGSSTGASMTGQLHHTNISILSSAQLGPAKAAPGVSLPPPPALDAASSRPCASLLALFSLSPLELGACLAACVRSDRSDGLFPTLVLEADGAALGLVYSSAASIAAAVRCGRGVYWSRSRGSLWRKGDTSGAWQTLRSIRLDCDADALCFTVTQHGEPPAFCHKSSLSCWGQPSGLHALQLTLKARRRSAPVGSYTKRLFDDANLLRNKLVEEAQELAEATEPEDVASECADVLYFAMVRCVAAGVEWKDVCQSLDLKAMKLARRPGNDKKERIEAAAKILEAKKGGGGGGGSGGGGAGGAGGSGGGAGGAARWLPVAAVALAAGAAVAAGALRKR